MVQRHQITLRERQWSQRQKGQCALSHFCSYSLPLKEPKKKTLEVSTPNGLLQHHLGSLPGLQFPGWKSFPLESCKMLVTDEIRVKHSCFPEHQGRLLPCNALGEMLSPVSAKWLFIETLTWLWAHRQVRGWPSQTPACDSQPKRVVSRSRELEESELKSCQTTLGADTVWSRRNFTLFNKTVWEALGHPPTRWLQATCLGKNVSHQVCVAG